MRVSAVEKRWSMPFVELLRGIAAQGLGINAASRITGVSMGTIRGHLRYKGESVNFERSAFKAGVSERERAPFWEFLSSLASSGFSRSEAARRIGVSTNGMSCILLANPELDPFSPSAVARENLKVRGETIVSTARKLLSEGGSVSSVARAIGYADPSGLRYAINARGLSMREFVKNARMGV